MSRIDRALRRSAGTAGSVVEHAGLAGVLADPLERYPVETAHSECPPGAALAGRPHTSAAGGKVAAALRALVSSLEGDALSLEQYARLAVALDEVAGARSLKSVVISSAAARDGKALTAANLAVTFAHSYRQRVVMVDADLRRPSLHQLFGVTNDHGLAEWLDAPAKALPVVTLSESLAIVPAGRAANPMASLASDGLTQLIDRLAETYDWVVLDTSPMVLSDGQLVARQGDGVVLVIGAGTTSYRLVERAIATIGPDRVVGTVLNRVARGHVPAGGYYAGYYGRPE